MPPARCCAPAHTLACMSVINHKILEIVQEATLQALTPLHPLTLCRARENVGYPVPTRAQHGPRRRVLLRLLGLAERNMTLAPSTEVITVVLPLPGGSLVGVGLGWAGVCVSVVWCG